MRMLLGAIPVFLISAVSIVACAASTNAQPSHSRRFFEFVQARVESPRPCRQSAACVCSISDEGVAARLLAEYGSVLAASDVVRLPPTCLFTNDAQVSEFQRGLASRSEIISGVSIELQKAAMDALLTARKEAALVNLRITPLDGSIAGKRSYADTVRIWNSRFLTAFGYWVRREKIPLKEAAAFQKLDEIARIAKVIEWENAGLRFGTNIKGSIFSSTAPPGSSQHLSMLAFDMVQYSNGNIRAIMNRHGWYQTVANDPPHFTFLGVTEKELPSRGLRIIVKGNYRFWVPDLR